MAAQADLEIAGPASGRGEPGRGRSGLIGQWAQHLAEVPIPTIDIAPIADDTRPAGLRPRHRYNVRVPGFLALRSRIRLDLYNSINKGKN